MVGNHVSDSMWLNMHRSVHKWLVTGDGGLGAMEKRGVFSRRPESERSAVEC